MRFSQKLVSGRLIKRYKRFLADVRLDSGEIITAHTPNSGSMKGLIDPGNRVYLFHHKNTARKLPFAWEIVEVGGVKVGINTHLPNRLVEEAIENGVIGELQGYASIQREQKYGKNSRIDLLLNGRKGERCFVEVKNVTLVEQGVAYFPDAVTERGVKHLRELSLMVRQGHRAVLCYVLQRSDGKWIAPADRIDPEYGLALRQAVKKGVEVMGYRAQVRLREIRLVQTVPISLSAGSIVGTA
jgi:sugar fermentation stimulation protein A